MQKAKDFENSGLEMFGQPKHVCCPMEFREVPNITGSHELDAMIVRTKNRDARARLSDYNDANIYGYRTGYDGYRGYHGDD